MHILYSNYHAQCTQTNAVIAYTAVLITQYHHQLHGEHQNAIHSDPTHPTLSLPGMGCLWIGTEYKPTFLVQNYEITTTSIEKAVLQKYSLEEFSGSALLYP